MKDPITLTNFLKLIDDPSVTEADLREYFLEDESAARGMGPGFRLNENMVRDEAGLESSGLLNGANFIAKRLRRRQYRQRLKTNPGAVRVVAEGDSWFQYPFKLHDVIDHIMDDQNFAVFCHSEAGDVMSNMAMEGEFYDSIDEIGAKIFIISGGGNDLVDGEGLRRFLLPFAAGRPAKDYLKPQFKTFMETLKAQYRLVFQRVLNLSAAPQIICHGYSNAIPRPTEGKWLGKPMSSLGITDAGLQLELVTIMLGALNKMLGDLAGEFPGKAHYMDLRGIVPANGWHDEFHPDSTHFGLATAPILVKMHQIA